jgi:hypothetical protein
LQFSDVAAAGDAGRVKMRHGSKSVVFTFQVSEIRSQPHKAQHKPWKFGAASCSTTHPAPPATVRHAGPDFGSKSTGSDWLGRGTTWSAPNASWNSRRAFEAVRSVGLPRSVLSRIS